MKKSKRDELRAAGWRTGSTAEFLGLSKEEVALIEIKIALAHGLRRRRARLELTQAQLAEQLGSSQSRVAKMEAADASVSIDLLLRSLLALGATRRDVAKLLSPRAA